MQILDIPRKISGNGSYIEIPIYHRAHVGLTQRMQVHVCLLPGSTSSSTDQPYICPELIVSAFDFDQWDKIWRLTISLHDRPGLVHDICETLSKHDINILASETSTIEGQNLHYIEMFIQIFDDTQLEMVEWTLAAKLFDGLEFRPDGNPRLQIRRVNNLLRAKKRYEQLARNLRDVEETPFIFKPIKERINLDLSPARQGQARSLRLRFPQRIRNVLQNTIYEGSGKKVLGYYLRISDTKDRFLRILFFKNSDSVIHSRIEYNDQIGALSSITNAVTKNGFNILSSFTTPADSNGKGRYVLELVIRGNSIINGTENIKRDLEKSLALSQCSRDLDLVIGYPHDYAINWKKKCVTHIGTCDSEPEDKSFWITELYNKVKLRHDKFSKDMQDGKFRERKEKWSLVNTLLTKYDNITLSNRPKTLFISCHYAGDLLDRVSRKAQCAGFNVITGKNLEEYPSHIDGLIEKISFCTHFLGVWSLSGSQKIGEECWPSPWLLWELGVAEARGLAWRLLISNSVSENAWRKLHPSQQHIHYAESTFETSLIRTLEVLNHLKSYENY